MAQKKRKKASFLKKTAILLGVFSVISVLACGIFAYRYFLTDVFSESRVVTVPDLVGTVYREGSTLGKDLQVVRVERFSDAPFGTVLSQYPAPGSERKAVTGKRFVTLTLYVSKGVEYATAPSVVGLPAEEGRALLLSQGFGIAYRELHSDAPLGEIIAQDIKGGIAAPKGSTVTLTVSLGAAVRKVRLPSLSGLTETRAESLLQSLGFKVGRITLQDAHGTEGIVLSQLPHAGASLPEGARIDLFISKKHVEAAPPEETESPEASTESDESISETAPAFPDDSSDDQNKKGEEFSPEDAIDRALDSIFERFTPFSPNN